MSSVILERPDARAPVRHPRPPQPPRPRPGRSTQPASVSRGPRRATRLRQEAAACQRLRADSDALPDDQVVGRILRFVVADGIAVYRVVSLVPLTLEHLAECGNYLLPPGALLRLGPDDIRLRVQRDIGQRLSPAVTAIPHGPGR